MIIQNATYNIIYPRAKNIRKDIFSLEDSLGELFAKPFSLIPIPDEAPEEIPRISATSSHGHSTLNISLSTAQLVVNYDENYWSDKDKCLKYIKDHVKKVYAAISNNTTNRFLFSGLSLNIVFDDLKGSDPIDIIMDNFYKIKSINKPYDINSKVTFIVDNKYYINISCSNIRTYEGVTCEGVNSLANMKQVSHLIGVNLDINDRYYFNYNPGYSSSSNEIDKILELTDDILTNKIYRFITKGGIEL